MKEMYEYMTGLAPLSEEGSRREKQACTRAVLRAVQPQKKPRVRRSLRIALAISAAAAAACMAAGVSAAANRNSDLLEKWFGKGAESSLTALPEPQVYENGQVRVTVEAEFDDGVNHLLLFSVETPDGEPYQLPLITHTTVDGEEITSHDVLCTWGKNPKNGWTSWIGDITEFGHVWNEPGIDAEAFVPTPENLRGKYQSLVVRSDILNYGDMVLSLIPDRLLTQLFEEPCLIDDPTQNDFAGIKLRLNPDTDTPYADYRAENGDTVRLSCFELTGQIAADFMNIRNAALILNDGSRRTLSDADWHGDVFGFLADVSQVAAVEINGTVYEKQ